MQKLEENTPEAIGMYVVTLRYEPEAVGAGSMVLHLAVNAVTGAISGQGEGTILEGTQHAPHFNASGLGHLHATGLGDVTKVGALSGQASVSVPPPAIGTYLAPFSATFAVNDDWTGSGSFSVGNNTYKCKVMRQ